MSQPGAVLPDKITDDELVKRVQQGDKEAFAELVQRHQRAVLVGCGGTDARAETWGVGWGTLPLPLGEGWGEGFCWFTVLPATGA